MIGLHDLLEVANWGCTFIAILGAYLVSNFDRSGFYCWIISNSFFAFYNIIIHNYAGAALFSIYLVLTVNGLIQNKG